MVRFNFFADRGAFTRDAQGYYRVDMPAMRRAVDELSGVLLKLQGDGDYAGVQELGDELGVLRPQLQADLDRLSSRAIPVERRIVFRIGVNLGDVVVEGDDLLGDEVDQAAL